MSQLSTITGAISKAVSESLGEKQKAHSDTLQATRDLRLATQEVSPQANAKLAKLKKACQDLEAVFLKDLLSVMRRSLPKSQFGNAPGAGIYEDMFDQAIAESASKSGSFGIGDMLFKRMSPTITGSRATDHGARTDEHVSPSTSSTLDIKG